MYPLTKNGVATAWPRPDAMPNSLTAGWTAGNIMAAIIATQARMNGAKAVETIVIEPDMDPDIDPDAVIEADSWIDHTHPTAASAINAPLTMAVRSRACTVVVFNVVFRSRPPLRRSKVGRKLRAGGPGPTVSCTKGQTPRRPGLASLRSERRRLRGQVAPAHHRRVRAGAPEDADNPREDR